MRSITLLIISLSLVAPATWAGRFHDTPQVSAPKLTDNRPVNPYDCEDQFGNKGARFCRSNQVPESYSLGEIQDRKVKKHQKHDR